MKRESSSRTTVARPGRSGKFGVAEACSPRAAPACGPARPISAESPPSSISRTLERRMYIDSFLSIAAWMSADRVRR